MHLKNRVQSFESKAITFMTVRLNHKLSQGKIVRSLRLLIVIIMASAAMSVYRKKHGLKKQCIVTKMWKGNMSKALIKFHHLSNQSDEIIQVSNRESIVPIPARL